MNKKILALFVLMACLMFLPMVSATYENQFIHQYNLENGNDVNGTLTLTNDGASFVTGKFLNGVYFNGATQDLSGTGTPLTSAQIQSNWTINFWLNQTSRVNDSQAFSFITGATGQTIRFHPQASACTGSPAFGGYDGASFTKCFTGRPSYLNQWVMYTLVYNVTTGNILVYENTVNTINISMGAFGSTGRCGTGVTLGQEGNCGALGSNAYVGMMDSLGFWTTTLNKAEIDNLYLSQSPFSVSGPAGNVSITLTDFYTGTSLTNFSATAINASGYQYNGTTTSGTLNDWTYTFLSTDASLWNITLASTENGGYLTRTLLNQNVSSNIASTLAQSDITFYGVEKITNNNISGMTFSTQYLTNTTHYMRAQSYVVNTSKSGFYNRSISYTPTALLTATQNISYIGNHSLNITARDNFTNALISSFNVRVTNTTFSYDETYTTTSGIIRDNTTAVQLNYEASATGYFNKTGTLTLSGNASNNSLILHPYGGLQVQFIRASNGTVITAPTQTVIFQNSTTSTSYTGTNGTVNVTGLAEATYNVLCQVTGFDNNSYVYSYPASTSSTPDVFYCVMSAGTTPITFQIQSPDLTPLSSVFIQIEQFVNGTPTTVSSEYTDGTGQAVMNLVQGVTTRITLSLAGYTTQINTNNLDSTTYTYTLDPVNRFDPSNSAGSSVTYSFYPTQFDLNLSVWDFSLNVTPDSGVNLSYFKILIANANGTTLNSINATTVSGGQLILPFNTTPYNGSTLRVTYSFKKTDNTVYEILVVYNIADKYVTGSLEGVRNYIVANFTLGERIFLWMFITVCCALLLSALGIKDLLNVVLVAMLWLGLAYVFALNMIIVGFMFFILMLVVLRYTL